MRAWTLSRETRLDALLEWCIAHHHANRMLVATRLDTASANMALLWPGVLATMRSLFTGYVLESFLASSWPGTELVDHDGVVFLVRLDVSLVEPMSRTGPRLFDWVGPHDPSLPEDICVFRRGDPWPILLSVTHESDAWIIAAEAPPFDYIDANEFQAEALLIPSQSRGFVVRSDRLLVLE